MAETIHCFFLDSYFVFALSFVEGILDSIFIILNHLAVVEGDVVG